MTTDDFTLTTLQRYNSLHPKEQGYLSYLQDGMPGNELPGKNPYKTDSANFLRWARGYKKGRREVNRYQNAYDAQGFGI